VYFDYTSCYFKVVTLFVRNLFRVRLPYLLLTRSFAIYAKYEFASSYTTRSTFATKGVLSVMRICSRMRDWPACVALAKNNFICVSIVKRDKRMREALCGALPCCRASACASVATILVPILETDGAHAPHCTNDLYRHATRIKLKFKLSLIRSVKFHVFGLKL
jgi:hypothetical protein